MNVRLVSLSLALVGFALSVSAAHAEIVIGAVLSLTGPGASLGIPYKNALLLKPRKIGNESVRFIVLDDASDPTTAVTDTHKLVTSERVDAIIGPTSTPQTLAVAGFANSSKVPLLVLAPVRIPKGDEHWIFVIPQSIPLMIDGVVADMKKRGVKTASYIGFADAWGDAVWQAFKQACDASGIRTLSDERYARSDTSVTAQVVRIMKEKPDAVLSGGFSTPAALPHIALTHLGYTGLQYDNHGSVNQDFLRVGGASVEGVIAPTGPLVVNSQLPASNPLKELGAEFTKSYDAKYGAGSANPFAGYAHDAYLMVETAAQKALKKAKPGTPEFRAALRDGIEGIKGLNGTEATYTMSPTDHYGAKTNARVLVQVKNGKWVLLSD